MMRRRTCRLLGRSAAGLYLCLLAATWTLGWDPLSISPHGPIQVTAPTLRSAPDEPDPPGLDACTT